MKLDKILDDNIILVIPDIAKKNIVKYISNLDKMYNLKIITFNEIKEHLFFSYDYKTIHYLCNKENINYNTSKKYLENMYYLIDKNSSYLSNLKQDLEDTILLYKDNLFKSYIKNKKIYFYGFTTISKWQQKIIDILNEVSNVEIVNEEEINVKPQVYEFNKINEEITFIANDIISKNLDLNKVYIANITNDYKEEIRRIFNNFNLPINFKDNISLYDNYYGINYLTDFNLDNIKDNDIKNKVIEALNKYYFIDDKKSIKDELKGLFKETKIKRNKYKTVINEIELKNNFINDDSYIYLIGFNNSIPKIYKDEDYFSDNVKPSYLDTSVDKNILEKKAWDKILKNTKNLTVTYSTSTLSGSCKKSPLLEDFEIIKKTNETISNYSNSNNIYNLSLEIDNYIKNKNISDNLKDLLATYKLNYNTYDNKYKNIEEVFDTFNFSYTKLNSYYECGFKYYLDYILRLTPYKNTFDTFLGSLFHYILSKVYDDNFDFETSKLEFMNENNFDLTLENKVFLNKTLKELKVFIDYIKKHYDETSFKEVEKEIALEINIDNVKFTGIIDKVMKNGDNVCLIDYKTGSITLDLSTVKNGLNLQLPIYIYLMKKVYPNSKIVGIYLEHIISPLFNNTGISIKDQQEDHFKLTGYSINDENIIKSFDESFEKSKYIKSMTFTDKGFGRFSKVLNEEDFNKLKDIAEEKITEAIKNIKNCDFTINPKILGMNNLSCAFCPYKSICFVKEQDYVNIKSDDILKGSDNDA